MREIKFRAWDKANKRMYQPFLLPELFHSHNHSLGGDYRADLEDMEFKYRTIGLDFMQFTGLLDKNGKEIYEGDVLEFSDRLVWYQSKYWVHMQFAKDNDELQKLKDKLAAESLERREVKIPDCYEEFSKADLNSYWEVIGNIFENPELLERKTNEH